MRADNSQHLVAAARRRAATTRKRAAAALRRMAKAGMAITFTTVAHEAKVSRSWLYSQDDLRAEIQRHADERPAQRSSPPPSRQRASETSLVRRLEAAHEQLRQLREENRQLREDLARAYGEQRAAAIIGELDRSRPKPPQQKKTHGPCN